MSWIDFLGPGYEGPLQDALEEEERRKKDRSVLDWIMENGDDALSTVDKALCVVNPNRAGCRAPTPQHTTVLAGGNQTVLYLFGGLILILLLLLLFKK